MNEPDDTLTRCSLLACLWEVTARKPGNVHRFKDFADTTYLDFVTSAYAIARQIGSARRYNVGASVILSVRLTREVAPTNTNLGIILLLVPLSKADSRTNYRESVEAVLSGLDEEDAEQVYGAIRFAGPGGLGRAEQGDIRDEPTLPLRQAMSLAADRDLIARQYANGFREVFDEAVPALLAGVERTGCVEGGIIHAHLSLMSRFPDSLIARKCGDEVARESAARAGCVLDLGWPHTVEGCREIVVLDAWLRADGHRRNPGTTADLIAASLFVALRTSGCSFGAGIPWPLAEGAP